MQQELVNCQKEVWISTDGSLKNNRVGAGVFLSNRWKKTLRVVEGKQNILNVELQAIEWVLTNTPELWKIK